MIIKVILALIGAAVIFVTTGVAARSAPLDDPLVRMVLQEAANEPFPGMVAVAAVALDRTADRRWPDTPKQVIYQSHQFSGMSVAFRQYSPKQVYRATVAVEVARSGTRPCGRALWYHATYVNPVWARDSRLQQSCLVGDHVFYTDAP